MYVDNEKEEKGYSFWTRRRQADRGREEVRMGIQRQLSESSPWHDIEPFKGAVPKIHSPLLRQILQTNSVCDPSSVCIF